jgi:hypothetical protein
VSLRLRGGLATQFCIDDCRSNCRNISRQLRQAESALVNAVGDDQELGVAAGRDEALRVVRWHLARFGSAC